MDRLLSGSYHLRREPAVVAIRHGLSIQTNCKDCRQAARMSTKLRLKKCRNLESNAELYDTETPRSDQEKQKTPSILLNTTFLVHRSLDTCCACIVGGMRQRNVL